MVDVLMICVGSRGDVQPFIVFAKALEAAGISSIVAAHPEYESFVAKAGCSFAPLPGSLPEGLRQNDAGRTVRDNSGKAALNGALEFLGGLSKEWLDTTLSLITQHRPAILLLTTMPLVTGGYLLLTQALDQQLLQQPSDNAGSSPVLAAAAGGDGSGDSRGDVRPPRLLVVHTHPTRRTAAFLPPALTSVLGLTAPLGLLNRLLWWLNTSMANKLLFAPLAAQTAARYQLQASQSCRSFTDFDRLHTPQTLCCYSPALVPKPADWPSHWHVVGPWLPAGRHVGGVSAADGPLPAALLHSITAARAAGLPVLYMGLGSMLSCMFDGAAGAERMLQVLGQAVELLQAAGQPCCAIIQSTPELHPLLRSSTVQVEADGPCPPDQAAACSSSSDSQQPDGGSSTQPAVVVWLRRAVPHTILLPLVDTIVHHGGMGTTHSAVAAGVPALVVPAALTSDQPFWGNVLQHAGAGRVTKQPAAKITPAQLAAQLTGMLQQRLQLKASTLRLAEEMCRTAGLSTAVQLVQQMLA